MNRAVIKRDVRIERMWPDEIRSFAGCDNAINFYIFEAIFTASRRVGGVASNYLAATSWMC
jgi:hypothetical protein